MKEDPVQTFQELVLRAKAGDQEAFGILYETHLTPVYRYAFIRLGNREEAEDIAQETFLRAYKAIDRFEVTTENFLPYLFTIARNLLINKGAKKTPEYMPGEDVDREASELRSDTMALEEEAKDVIREALLVLNDGEREIIELRFFGERSYPEISAICDKREDAIRQQVARALKKMRLHLSEKNFTSK